MSDTAGSPSSTAVDRRRLSSGVGVYAWLVGAVGLTAVAVSVGVDRTVVYVHLPLALTALVSSHAPIRLQLGGGNAHAVTLGESTVVAMLIAAPTGAVPLLTIAALALSAVARRVEPTKVAYNLGADGLATTLALAVVLGGLGDIGGDSVGSALLVGVTAAAVYQLVQLGLIAELLRRLAGVAPDETVRSTAGASFITVLFTTMFGALLGIGARFDPAVAWLGPPLLLGLWVAMRDLNAAANATHTSLHLHEVTNDLADTSSDLGSAIDKIAETFGARAVLLSLPGDDGPVERVHDADGGGLDDLREALAGVDAVGDPVRVETARHAVAVVAPVAAPAGTGHLVVAGTRVQWTDREVALLGTVATHLGTNLRTFALLEQVTAESRKLTDIIEAAGDGIALIAADGTVATWNPGMQLLTGVGADAVGRPLSQVLTWRDAADGSRDGALPPALTATLAGGQPDPVDLEVLRGDRWRSARCRFSPVGTPERGVTGAVLVARDRTLEADLVQVKHDFIAIVSHEIRTPLTPLKGMVELLGARGRDVPDEVRMQMVGAMQRQLARLDTLVADLLVVADLDGGTLALHVEPIAAAAVCREAVVAQVPDEQRPDVALELADDVTVAADRVALLRVVESLVSNAVKHGGPHVEVRVVADGAHGVIEVRDDGPGIPEWEHDAVFERFRRVGTNLEWSTQGPGLGLAIAAELAEQMGLVLELESSPGQGACFRVVAPLAPAVASPHALT